MLTYLSCIAFVVFLAAFFEIFQEVLNIGLTLICCSSTREGRTSEFSGKFGSNSLVDLSKFSPGHFLWSVCKGASTSNPVPHCMSNVPSAKMVLLLEFSNLAFTSGICYSVSYPFGVQGCACLSHLLGRFKFTGANCFGPLIRMLCRFVLLAKHVEMTWIEIGWRMKLSLKSYHIARVGGVDIVFTLGWSCMSRFSADSAFPAILTLMFTMSSLPAVEALHCCINQCLVLMIYWAF